MQPDDSIHHYRGKETLEFMRDAMNYNSFLESRILGFLGDHQAALDFGAGNGEFAIRLTARGKSITTVETDPELQAALKKFAIPVADKLDAVAAQQRIYSMNVLEHIEDDVSLLKQFHAKLTESGKLLLYVPAFMCLYSDFDKSVGHFRRYRKKELIYKLQIAGFSVESVEHVDVLGFFCWMLLSHLPGKKTTINPRAIIVFDRIIFPASLLLDRITSRWIGKNLLIVARR